jgi:long-chain acyl-CoA synthetase
MPPRRLNAARPDYHAFDHIAHIRVVRAPLSAEDGTLTRTFKPRRQEIARVHAAAVAGLLAELRG